MWKDRERLRAAYYDKVGITGLFIKNGMRNALALLGHEVSTNDEESWVYEVDINEHLHQVEMYLKFPTDLKLPQHRVHIRYFLKEKVSPPTLVCTLTRYLPEGNFVSQGFKKDPLWRR